jgi:hypothetical protein
MPHNLPFGFGAAYIVIVSVTRAYVSKAVYGGRGRINVAALRLIGSSSIDQYLVADGQFTVSPIQLGTPACAEGRDTLTTEL